MGYYLTEPIPAPPAKIASARPSAWRKKKGLGAPFLQAILSTKYCDGDLGLYYYGYRYYSPGIGRWMSRDPIDEMTFRTVFYARAYMAWHGFLMGNNSLNLFSLLSNEPASWNGSVGAVSIQANRYSITDSGKPEMPQRGYNPGSIRCNEKCEMEITGCDKWEKIVQPCCIKHEEVHLGQVGEIFCKWQTVTTTLTSGEKKEEKCCPDAGKVPRFGTPQMKNMKKWPDGECPAYKASVECLDETMRQRLSNQERKLVLDHLRFQCREMKKQNCPDIPDACETFLR